MTEVEIRDNKGFLIRGGHVKIINFIAVGQGQLSKPNDEFNKISIPLYDLTYAIQDLELVIKENKAQGRLKKLAKRERRKDKLAPLLCIWNTKDVSEHTKHMCTYIMLGKKMLGDTRLTYVFNLFKNLMDSKLSYENIKQNTNTAGAWIFSQFCRWYSVCNNSDQVLELYNHLVKINLGALAYRHLCINIIFNIPFVHNWKGNINLFLPSFRYTVRTLLSITLKHIIKGTFNPYYIEQYNKTYLYKAKHFSLIPLGLNSTQYAAYSNILFQTIKNIIKRLLNNNIKLSTDNNVIFSLETFMNVVDNYGCIVLYTKIEQKDEIMGLLSGEKEISVIESININKEIDNKCLLIQIKNRISLILYICEDIGIKASINNDNYMRYVGTIQEKYMYILKTLDSNNDFVDPRLITQLVQQRNTAMSNYQRVRMNAIQQQNENQILRQELAQAQKNNWM